METLRKPSLHRGVSKFVSNQTHNSLIDGVYKNIMLGRFENCPSLGTRMIKIFLSSTFADMAKERNVIMKQLYPNLRLYCRQKYGIEFQILDMRWGVPSETQLDHRGPELCYQEIINCKEISCGINFITIVGHRYGTISLPFSIKGSDFLKIIAVLHDHDINIDILKEWYIIDNNNDPPIYTLRPIPVASEEPTDDEIRAAREEWSHIKDTLTTNITMAIDLLIENGQMTLRDKKKFSSSVTEQEIEMGICNESDTKINDIAAAFVREIIDIDTFLNNPKVNRYIDVKEVNTKDSIDDQIKVVVDESLNKIMQDIINFSLKSNLSDTNIRHFKTTWHDINKDDDDCQYISNFKSEFVDVVTNIIDKNMKDNKYTNDDLYNEVLQHTIECLKHVKHFQGRAELLEEVKKYIQGNTKVPFIVYGESGSGKTSILAKSAFLSRSWLDDNDSKNAIILLRFLGTSPGTSNIRKTIRYLCRQLNVLSVEDDDSWKTDDFKELLQIFYKSLTKASELRKIVIFLDSIDQLQQADGAYSFSWLVTPLPANVKIILSTIPHHENILDNIRLRIDDISNFLEVKPLEQSTCMDILLSLLHGKERTITELQKSILNDAFMACSLPIYVTLVFKTVLKWRSYYTDVGSELSLLYTVREAIFQFFRNLEKLFNKTYVRHSLAYITASRNGLSESELEDILSLDDKVLQSVFIHHLPPQIRVPPFLWSRIRQEIGSYLVEREADNCRVLYWYHRQFIEMAHEYLLGDKKFKSYIHDHMSDYFLGTFSNNKPKRFYYPPNIVKKLNLPPYTDEGRNMPNQPLIHNQTENVRFSENLFNYRKVNELPWHLSHSGRLAEFADNIAFNYDFMRTKLLISSRSSLLEDLSLLNGQIVSYQNSLTLLYNAIRMSTLSLSQDPLNISFDIIGRLSKYDNQSHPRIMDLLNQCRNQSSTDIGFIPINQCLESGSGLLHLWYDIGLSMGFVLPNNQLMAISMVDMMISYYDIDGNIVKTAESDTNIFMALKYLLNRRPNKDQSFATVVLNKLCHELEEDEHNQGDQELVPEKIGAKEKLVKTIYQLNLYSGRLTEIKELDNAIAIDSILDINDSYIQIDTRLGMAKLFNYKTDRYLYEYMSGVVHTCIGLYNNLASVIYKPDSTYYMDIINLENEEITTIGISSNLQPWSCCSLTSNLLITMFRKEENAYFYRYEYNDGVLEQYNKPIIAPLKNTPKRVKTIFFNNNADIALFTVQLSNTVTNDYTTHGFVYNRRTDSILSLVINGNQSKFRKHCKVFGDSVQALVSDDDLLITTGEKCILMTWSLRDGSLLQVITLGNSECLLSGIYTDMNKVALCHFPDDSNKGNDERMYILLKVYNIDKLREPMNITESIVNDEIEILDEHISYSPNDYTYREFSTDIIDGLLLSINNVDTFIIDTFESCTIKMKHMEGSFLNLSILASNSELNKYVFRIENVNMANTEIIEISSFENTDEIVDKFSLDSSLKPRLNPPIIFMKEKDQFCAFSQLFTDWIISFENESVSDFKIKAFNLTKLLRKTVNISIDLVAFCHDYNDSVEEKLRIFSFKLRSITLRSGHSNQVVIMFSCKDRKYDEVLRVEENKTILWSGVIVIVEFFFDDDDIAVNNLKYKIVSHAVADIGNGLALLSDGLHGINYKLEKIDITTGIVVEQMGQLANNNYILNPIIINDGRYLLGTMWIAPYRVAFSIGLDDDNTGDPDDMFAILPPRTIQIYDLTTGYLIGNYPFENDPETILMSRNDRMFIILTINEPIKCLKINDNVTKDLFIYRDTNGKQVGHNGKKVTSSYGYLKLSLTEAMREIVNKRPSDPIAYLSEFLRNV